MTESTEEHIILTNIALRPMVLT